MFEWDSTWCRYYAGVCENPPDDLLDLGWFTDAIRYRVFSYPDRQGQPRMFPVMKSWYDYVQSLSLVPGKIPLPQIDAFDDALRALFMAYFTSGFCKLAETKALTALEDALKVAYRHDVCYRDPTTNEHKKCAGLGTILEKLEKKDPFYAGMADNTKGDRRFNAINVIRDKQTHGRQGEVMPWGGLFERVKETIEHAFESWGQYDVHQMRWMLLISRWSPIICSFPYGV